MNIHELISTLQVIAEASPEFANKPLIFVDRDNCVCDVENVRLLDSFTDDTLHIDLGGQYMSKEEDKARIGLYCDKQG